MTSTETQDPRLLALEPFFVKCEQNIRAHNLLASRVEAAEGNREAALIAWMEGSTDPDAVAIREAIERAKAKLKTLADANVPESEVSPEEKIKLKAELEVSTKTLKAASRALRNLGEQFGLDVTEKLQAMGDPFLPKATTGTGSSLPRPSVWVETVKDGNEKSRQRFDNLSGAANHMDIPLEELGKLYAKVAGVNYEEISKVREQQEFEWKNTALKDAPLWTIKTTPKPTTRGREAVKVEATEAA